MIIGHDKVSKWFGLIGMIIGFTFVEGITLKRIIELILYRKILKSPYLNLNTCKVVQIFWAMLLLDRLQ
jgi:hypothetical protein